MKQLLTAKKGLCEPKRIALGLCCLIFLLLSSGCQFAPKMPASKWPWSKKEELIPDRLLAVWSDTVLHQPGLPGIRGFGGRVYFYQAPETDPIKVDGAIAVYIFDADEFEPTQQHPLRKFVFTAEQLADHMSKTSMGPSYSLWLPWDEVGGPSKRLSLITRFEAKQGGTVISDPAIKLLPGIPQNSQEKSPSDRSASEFAAKGNAATSSARLVVHQQQEPVVNANQLTGAGIVGDSSSDNGVHTIDLPPSFQQHIRNDSRELPRAKTKPNELDQHPLKQHPIAPLEIPVHPQAMSAGEIQNGQPVIPASGTFTQVIDSRTRRGFQPSSGYQPRTERDRDIREGRWLEPPRSRPSVGSSSNKE